MKPRSVFDYAARGGIPMGIMLTAVSLLFISGVGSSGMQTGAMLLSTGIPVILWILQRKMWNECPHYRRVSSLWLMGIYTFIFGSLICMLLSNLYILAFAPNFVADYARESLRMMESSPDPSLYAEQTEILHQMLRHRALPTPFGMTTTMAWATCFFGSLLSLLWAFLIRATKHPRDLRRA